MLTEHDTASATRSMQPEPNAGLSPWRWVAAAAALTTTAAHIPVTAPHLSEAPYIGWLFVTLEVTTALLAVLLVLRENRLVWSLAASVAALAVGAYTLTRLVALPKIGDDAGNWSEPLGLLALTAELTLLGLALGHHRLAERRPRLLRRPVVFASAVLVLGLGSTAYGAGREPADTMGGAVAMDHMISGLAPLGWGSFGAHWHARPWWLLFSWVALSAYIGGLLVARRAGVRAVHPARVASFVAGIAVLLLAVSSAIDTYAMALFWDHMIEHLLLIMVVPVLLVLGHPITVLRSAAATYGKEGALDAFLRSRPVVVLTHPGVGLALYTTVIVGTHLTGFMDAMATHGWLMWAEQWLYVLTGYLYLLPLVGAEPIRWRLPYLARPALILLGMTPDTVVGIVLLQTTYNMFPIMEGRHPSWAPAPIDDLHIGGALMWVCGDGLMMLFGVGVILAMITHPGSDQMIGRTLEKVRRRTLTDHLIATGGTAPADDVDIDDDAMLDAYNRMLARMNDQSEPSSLQNTIDQRTAGSNGQGGSSNPLAR